MSETAVLYRTFDFEHHFPGEEDPRRWELPRPNVGTKKAYAKHLERLMVQGVNRHRDILDDTAYRFAMDSWTKGLVTGRFNWGSKEFHETLEDVDNLKELLRVWFLQVDSKVTHKLINQLWDERAADLVTLVYEMLFEKNPTHAPAQSGADSR